MKIRTGFVSNSSSSSFFAVVENEAFEKMKNDLNPIGQFILDGMLVKTRKLGDTTYVVLYKYKSTEDCNLTPLIKVLQESTLRMPELPQFLIDIEDPNDWNVCDAFQDNHMEDWEYMGEQEDKVFDELSNLVKKGLAITHRE